MPITSIAFMRIHLLFSRLSRDVTPVVRRTHRQSFGCLVERKAKRGGDAGAIRGIGFGAVGDITLLDFDARVTHGAGGAFEEKLLLLGGHLPEQDARLLVVVVVDAMIPVRRIAFDR